LHRRSEKKLQERHIRVSFLRAHLSIVKQFYGSIVITKPSVKVITIEPALRAFAKQHQLTSDACPYFSQTETMKCYLSAEAEAA
jgi:hypothetical protein